jgi:hypothetical protein
VAFIIIITDVHLGDTQVIELNPSSYLGYEVKHTAFHGAQLYDEAIEAFQIMLSKLDNASDRSKCYLPRASAHFK